jgi:hypothetical protein
VRRWETGLVLDPCLGGSVTATTRKCRVCEVPLPEEVQGERCRTCEALASRRILRAAIDGARLTHDL